MENKVYKDLYEAQSTNKQLVETLNFVIGSLVDASGIDIQQEGSLEKFIEEVTKRIVKTDVEEAEIVVE
ncbi:hypothetical protein LPLM1_00044 [Listeria phage LPML1]|nr:hypothetical protein LPLM1_00044 [Listeria phage LPML1]